MEDFRDLRSFIVLELTMKNAKRAGVLADIAVVDIEVNSLILNLNNAPVKVDIMICQTCNDFNLEQVLLNIENVNMKTEGNFFNKFY